MTLATYCMYAQHDGRGSWVFVSSIMPIVISEPVATARLEPKGAAAAVRERAQQR